jgi:hypothetical protein
MLEHWPAYVRAYRVHCGCGDGDGPPVASRSPYSHPHPVFQIRQLEPSLFRKQCELSTPPKLAPPSAAVQLNASSYWPAIPAGNPLPTYVTVTPALHVDVSVLVAVLVTVLVTVFVAVEVSVDVPVVVIVLVTVTV